MTRKSDQQSTIFRQDTCIQSRGRRLPVAAVFKSGLDVRIAKNGAYSCHPGLCLWSLSRNSEDGSPSSYCELER